LFLYSQFLLKAIVNYVLCANEKLEGGHASCF